MSVPNDGQDSKSLLREILRCNAEALAAADRQRVAAAKYARSVGLTYQQIADVYGMTEGAVRHMLKRAEGDAL